jgi:mono/diheme cytochrome c family protein
MRARRQAHEKIVSVIARIKIFNWFVWAVLVACVATPAHAFSGRNTKADEQAGALLFRDKGCAYCHGAGGVGGKKAPSLMGLREDKAWPPEKISSQILNGGQKMPPFSDSVTDEQVAQLVAYLRAKHRPVPPPAPPVAPVSPAAP